MFDTLIRYLLDGDHKNAILETNSLLAAGVPREKIVTFAVEETMSHLDEKCTVQHFNLLEIMLVGRAVMEVMKILYRDREIPVTKGTVALVALEGDVHDIGKNIVKMVLTSRGYRVIDCGKDCAINSLIAMLRQAPPMVLGVAGLISTVIPQVQSLKQNLKEAGMGHINVVAGGGALRQLSPGHLNVEAVAQTVFDLDRYLAVPESGCDE
ncbi:MAG: cobalamin-dependent protein [Negativicutes bacterium]|nr:cobalamin-dependent protein [Negativicutes bacterium]